MELEGANGGELQLQHHVSLLAAARGRGEDGPKLVRQRLSVSDRPGEFQSGDLSGRTVVVAMDFPGPTLAEGRGTARLYIDDGAIGPQRRELEAIFQGKRGGGMRGLGSLVSRWLPTQSTPISVREKKGELTAAVGAFGTVRSRRLKNAAGRVVQLRNVTLLGASPIDLAPSGSDWHDPEMPRSFRTESGGVGRIAWKG